MPGFAIVVFVNAGDAPALFNAVKSDFLVSLNWNLAGEVVKNVLPLASCRNVNMLPNRLPVPLAFSTTEAMVLVPLWMVTVLVAQVWPGVTGINPVPLIESLPIVAGSFMDSESCVMVI